MSIVALATVEQAAAHDALVVVLPSPLDAHAVALGASLAARVSAARALDASLGGSKVSATLIAAPEAPGGRLVLCSVGALDHETDDVRAYADAGEQGVARAVRAGAVRPALLVVAPPDARFARAADVAALGALAGQWAPLEAREAGRASGGLVDLGVVGLSSAEARRLDAIEQGRALARDIAGTEPERMAPLRIAELCESAFAGTPVSLRVERDLAAYPLIAAVARASTAVERHRPCVVRLEYAPAGAPHTLLVAGKGVTYDTGGADLKTDGHMAGMSRDKGGAAAVAGLVHAVAALQLPVRVVGLLGCVRNSIGADSYVTDEIVTSRAGVRVRIGNTDAEGRLVLADLLAAAREEAAGATDPLLMTVATLTGHVYRAHGPYVGALGNARAREASRLPRLAALGETWGEPFEWTRPRREDYAFIAARGPTEDVLSCNSAPSVSTPRGHQFPFAFLDRAAGVAGTALPFVHVDIGGVGVTNADWQFGRPTAAPIPSLVAFLEGLRAG